MLEMEEGEVRANNRNSKNKKDSIYKLSVGDIDAQWLPRMLSPFFPDANECLQMTENVLDSLSREDDSESEQELITLLFEQDTTNKDRKELVQLFFFLRNHIKVETLVFALRISYIAINFLVGRGFL